MTYNLIYKGLIPDKVMNQQQAFDKLCLIQKDYSDTLCVNEPPLNVDRYTDDSLVIQSVVFHTMMGGIRKEFTVFFDPKNGLVIHD